MGQTEAPPTPSDPTNPGPQFGPSPGGRNSEHHLINYGTVIIDRPMWIYMGVAVVKESSSVVVGRM
eukprot:10983687-Lingulodinium_polyedra.AAC.1